MSNDEPEIYLYDIHKANLVKPFVFIRRVLMELVLRLEVSLWLDLMRYISRVCMFLKYLR